MSSYILSLLGIVLVSVLIEIILPSGQTSKYIKSILAVFVIYVCVSPIINFLKSDFDINKYINKENINIDETLLKEIYKEQATIKALDIEKAFEEKGFKNVKVRLTYKIVENELIFEKAIVNIGNLVITGTNQNINKYDYIRGYLVESLCLKEENVVFEWQT